MFSSLYSEIEESFKYQNSTMTSVENSTGHMLSMIVGDNSTDVANLGFWQEEFGITDPGVTTPQHENQVSTGNTSAAGKRHFARSHQLSWLNGMFYLRRDEPRCGCRLPLVPNSGLFCVHCYKLDVKCGDFYLPEKG